MSGTPTPPQQSDRDEPAASLCIGSDEPPGPTRIARSWSAVRGVVFDMGDILYDATLWRRWLLKLLHRLGYNYSYRSFFASWDRDFLDEVHRGGRDYQQAFDAFLASQGLPRGLIDEVVAASHTRKREIAATLRPLPGVRATLVELQARGLPMAVLSDSESSASELRQRLRTLGIGDCFEAVVSSRDMGLTKPAAMMYQTAAKALGLRLDEAAFVGHDADELDGAMAVGMPTIAFNYDGPVNADIHLRRFEQLLTLLSPECMLARAG